MKLDLAEVRHVAQLARLALTETEETLFATQLSAVLDAVEQLSAVGSPNSNQAPVGWGNETPARPDEVKDELPVESVLKNAPQKVGTSFALPKVIE
jgi:aspartyl-tRNA(Asn)/glutamyl-tRNA(Gln) amidotransferase subunit C